MEEGERRKEEKKEGHGGIEGGREERKRRKEEEGAVVEVSVLCTVLLTVAARGRGASSNLHNFQVAQIQSWMMPESPAESPKTLETQGECFKATQFSVLQHQSMQQNKNL